MRKQAKKRVNGYHFEEIVFGSQNQLMDRALHSVLTKYGASTDPVKERAFAAFNRLLSMAKTPAEQDELRRAWSDPNFQARYPAEYQQYFQMFADEMGFTYNQAPSFDPSTDNDTYLATRNPSNNVEMQDSRQRAQQRVGQKAMDARADASIYQRQREKAEEAEWQERAKREFGYNKAIGQRFNISRDEWAAKPQEEKDRMMREHNQVLKQQRYAQRERELEQQRQGIRYNGGFNTEGQPTNPQAFAQAQQNWNALEAQVRAGVATPSQIARWRANPRFTEEQIQAEINKRTQKVMASRYGVNPAALPATAIPVSPTSLSPTAVAMSSIRTPQQLREQWKQLQLDGHGVRWDRTSNSYTNNGEALDPGTAYQVYNNLQTAWDTLSEVEKGYYAKYYQPKFDSLTNYISTTLSNNSVPTSSEATVSAPSSIPVPSAPPTKMTSGGILENSSGTSSMTAAPTPGKQQRNIATAQAFGASTSNSNKTQQS